MVYTTREYTQKVILSLNGLLDTQYAQLQIRKKFLNQLSDNQLSATLSSVTSILSLAFALNTPASVTAGVVSLLASFAPSEKQDCSDLITAGYYGLGEPIQFMRNSEYDLIEIEFPFIEYTDRNTGKSIHFITSDGIITRVHSGSGWILSE